MYVTAVLFIYAHGHPEEGVSAADGCPAQREVKKGVSLLERNMVIQRKESAQLTDARRSEKSKREE
ncbi:MAG: hypothetical protein K1W41_21975 [Lachnospiraceae bacterium]